MKIINNGRNVIIDCSGEITQSTNDMSVEFKWGGPMWLPVFIKRFLYPNITLTNFHVEHNNVCR